MVQHSAKDFVVKISCREVPRRAPRALLAAPNSSVGSHAEVEKSEMSFMSNLVQLATSVA